MALGLGRLSEGRSSEDAFTFPKRRRGHEIEVDALKKKQDHFLMAYRVEYLQHFENLRPMMARERVATQMNKNYETVRKAWEKYSTLARHEIQMQCKYTGKARKG